MNDELDLRQFLGPDLFDQLGGLGAWSVEGPEISNGKATYRISLDGVSYRFIYWEGRALALEWESETPGDLRMDGETSTVIDFLNFATIYLPNLLFDGAKKPKETRNRYGKSSELAVYHRNGDGANYKLGRRDDLIRLTEVLLNPDSSGGISGFLVNGRRDSSDSQQGRFAFGLEYSESDFSRGVYSLGVPLIAENARAFNIDVMRWTFSVHEGFVNPKTLLSDYLSEPGGELILANDLSAILVSKFPQLLPDIPPQP